MFYYKNIYCNVKQQLFKYKYTLHYIVTTWKIIWRALTYWCHTVNHPNMFLKQVIFRWDDPIIQTEPTRLLEGRFLLLVAGLSSHRNVSEGALEALAVSLPAEQSTASLSYLSSETYWLKWERLGGLDSPRRTPREKSRRWQFWRSPDQSLIWDCHWYSTGRSWYRRISGKPLSRNLQTIPVETADFYN